MPAKKEETAANVAEDILHRNMRFYGQVQNTPKEAQKEFNNGRFSGTDINPMWRIKKLTEVFGPTGFGWWTQNVRYEFVEANITPPPKGQETPFEQKEISVFCELELIVKDPETGEVSQPIYGVGGNTYVRWGKYGPSASDEAKKMAYTDALSIACKALGFSHDIYYQSDRTKYTPENRNDTAKNADPAESILNLRKAAQDKVKAYIAATKMGADEKKSFVADFLIPIVGGNGDYNKCNDPAALKKLIAELDKKLPEAA